MDARDSVDWTHPGPPGAQDANPEGEPADADPAAGREASPQRLIWRWFRLVGLPAIVLVAIAAALVWLRAPSGDGNAVTLDAGALGDGGGEAAEEGRPAPDFVLQTSDGRSYRLSELRGHPVVLNFWATWCGPCKQEMPAFEQEARARTSDGLIVLAINVQEPADRVDPYVEKLGLTFPVLLDRAGNVSARYHVRALPTTVFIRPDGTVDSIRPGAYSRRLLADRLDQFLGGE